MAEHNTNINDTTELDNSVFSPEWINFLKKQDYAKFVFIRVLSVIEIPIMILTLIALSFLIKSRPAASVFVSHLILSDLIQVICMIITSISSPYHPSSAYYYSLIVGLYFMACVAFERYLLVCHPIWYKSNHSVKLSCLISLIIWFVPLIFAEIFAPSFYFKPIPQCIACLIPYPIIILCFAGTCRGLFHSISLTSLKRKLILGSLFLVLLTYTFLILPFVIMELIKGLHLNNALYLYKFGLIFDKFYCYVELLLYVNPLADCLLYLFMRPDVGNIMKSVHCCCRHQSSKHNQDKHSVVNPQNSCTTSVCYISAQKSASHSLNTCSSV